MLARVALAKDRGAAFLSAFKPANPPKGQDGRVRSDQTRGMKEHEVAEDIRHARLENALGFVERVLLPKVEEGAYEGLSKKEQESLLKEYLTAYKNQVRPGLGDDFDVLHVWIHTFAHVAKNARVIREGGQALPDAEAFEKALALLEGLDLEQISHELASGV